MKKIKGFLHGGDYNADQWLDRPDILQEDIRLMKQAGVNCVTLGVFSWSSLEPREDEYTFEWLDKIMDSLYENGIYVILATPSGGKPPWMGKKYPEVMRMNSHRVRLRYGERENQCNSSSVFREKLKKLDGLLAERYAHHPALILWHISNELWGECHCPACQKNFRQWLQRKYGTIEKLNEQYWSGFWSHRYQDWEELESPGPEAETAIQGLMLDWRRFYSDLTIDLARMEIDTVKHYNPEIPVTTNYFHLDCGFDYGKMAESLDVISFDKYPAWNRGKDLTTEWENGMDAAFYYDVSRSLKQKPFLLMETTPSVVNWADVNKLKRPGIHKLGCMQAVAQGADSVQYFQWRKSRGGDEKFHGAVVGHDGTSETRVFREVAELGAFLKEYSDVVGTGTASEAALIYDWENIGALNRQKSLRRREPQYEKVMKEYHEALTRNYVPVDVISQKEDFGRYKVVFAPMLYLFEPGTEERIRDYIAAGGIFVMGFYSGLVNENDLVYEGFAPHGLNDVFGVRAEEIDCLCDEERNHFRYGEKEYACYYYCELLQENGAEVLSRYEEDFYSGKPVLTRKIYGRGMAYYLTSRTDMDFLTDFCHDVLKQAGVRRTIEDGFVSDVMVKERSDGERRFIFFLNFSREEREIAGRHLKGYEVRIEVQKRIPG